MAIIKMKNRQLNQIKASEKNKLVMTVQSLKEFGRYVEFSETRKGFIYELNEKMYLMNGEGIKEIGY